MTKNGEDWYKREKSNGLKDRPKEIVIKLNTTHLKKAGYILLIVVLILIIGLQHYYKCVVPCNCTGITGSAVKDASKTNEKAGGGANDTKIVIVGNGSKNFSSINTSKSLNNSAEKEDELLPITGEVAFTIDNIEYVVKGEDYARITSVKFTIVNQKMDFVPAIKGYLTQYAGEEEKDVTLELLEAGRSITITEPGLTFGYNNIDKEQTLKLELYDNKKQLVVAQKTFRTNK